MARADMEDVHRELLVKRQKYLRDNVIMEPGLLRRLKDAGVFSNSMIHAITVRTDAQDLVLILVCLAVTCVNVYMVRAFYRL